MSSTKGSVECETDGEVLLVPTDLVKKTVGVAVDIGGSMMKIVFRSKDNLEEVADKGKDFGRLQLVSFPKEKLQQGLDYVAERCTLSRSGGDRLPTVCATGTGGWEFRKAIAEKFNVRVKSVPEFECFAKAFIYLASHLSREHLLHPYDDEAAVQPVKAMEEYVQVMTALHKSSKTPSPSDKNSRKALDFSGREGKIISESNEPVAEAEEIYPCLLTVCGSVVTYILINKDKTFQLVEHSARGGKGFHALGSLLTGCKTFDELLELAAKGNRQNVDIFTNSLFPTDDKSDDADDDSLYARLSRMTNPGLVYCFGKAAGARLEDFRREDLASTCLNYVVNDFVQQLFILSRLHKIGRIFLCGSFCNSQLVRRAVTTELVRKNLTATFVKAQSVPFDFIKAGPHLGALGALIGAMSDSSNCSEDESAKA